MSLIKKSLTDQDWPGSLAHTRLESENKSIFVSDWNHIFIHFPFLLLSRSQLLKSAENNRHQKVKITPPKVLLDICGILWLSLALSLAHTDSLCLLSRLEKSYSNCRQFDRTLFFSIYTICLLVFSTFTNNLKRSYSSYHTQDGIAKNSTISNLAL